MRKVLSLLIIFILALVYLPSVAEESESSDPVILTIDGRDILLSEIDSAAYSLYDYGYISDTTDYATVLQYVISAELQMLELHALKLDEFTDEETEAFMQEAQTTYDDMLEYYIQIYQTSEDMTEEEMKDLKERIINFFSSQGYTVEALTESLKYNASIDLLLEHLKKEGNITVSEEEIKDYFEYYAEQDKEYYSANLEDYEYYVLYSGGECWYQPAGYRGILSISLDVDAALLDAYQTAQALLEEEDSADTQKVDDARAAIIASVQETIDEIFSRLKNGESFVNLIHEYNSDATMEDEEILQNGLSVSRNSYVYDYIYGNNYVIAAFDENMLKPGDTSDVYVGLNGVYVLYYLRDIPEGYIDLTEEIRMEITEELESEKLDEVYESMVETWKEKYEIIYNEENMNSYLKLRMLDGKIVPVE